MNKLPTHLRTSYLLALSVLTLVLAAGSPDENSFRAGERRAGWENVPKILSEIVPPIFPDREFVITDYGAVADGKTICTAAFKKAIEECSRSGGGRVVVPAGTYLTGAIHLKSNVDLHLSKGAVIKFSTNPSDYLPVVYTRWEGVELMNYSPLVYAYGQKNVALTGEGVLDGQADVSHWWPWKGSEEFGWKPGMHSQLDDSCRPLLMKMGDENLPVSKRIFGEGHFLRPTFVEFYECQNVLIKDVSLENAPFWFVHPALCKNVTIEGITTNSNGPNTDGCDPESCTDVVIRNCVFNDGDDCIAIKSGRNNDGRRVNVPSTDIVVVGCRMKNGHGGVSIGSEISGGCWNVYVDSCMMDSPNLNQVLRVKSNSKRGGVVRNIFLRDINVGQVSESIVRLDMQYDPEEAAGYDFLPVMKNIYIDRVESHKSKYALYFAGLASSHIDSVFISNCNFDSVAGGNRLRYAEDVSYDKVYMNGKLIGN